MTKRPKNMTAGERNSLPIGEPPPDGTVSIFAIENDDILCVKNKDGTGWGFAQRHDDESWFRYRMAPPPEGDGDV